MKKWTVSLTRGSVIIWVTRNPETGYIAFDMRYMPDYKTSQRWSGFRGEVAPEMWNTVYHTYMRNFRVME